MSTAESFLKLFEGLDRAHGRYVVPRGTATDSAGKLIGTVRHTVDAPPTLAVWEKHLQAGSDEGVGIIPIRDDATVRFGAFDVDVYPLDIVALEKERQRLGLPLVLCRTKSGGAHLYIFTSEPVNASLVRQRLMEWSVAVGYPGIEVFPKQSKLASKNDTGNWINMPYQGGEHTTRYALKPDGSAATMDEFLAMAAERSVDKVWLETFVLPPEALGGAAWEGAPPCLETLARKGFAQGSRNNALFNIAIYLQRRFPDDLSTKLDEYNERFVSPPLPANELADIKRSITRKKYSYKCKDDPICHVCQKPVCRKREHGVGGKGTSNTDVGVDFGRMVKLKTEPPMYIWDVDGIRLEFEYDDLIDQRRFGKVVGMRTNKIPLPVKGDTWFDLVRAHMLDVDEREVPIDATREGQWDEHLHDFCTSRVKARAAEELLLGKPYTGGMNGSDAPRTYFRVGDFISYLQQHKVTGTDERLLFVWLQRSKDLAEHDFEFKGKPMKCWSIQPYREQTEPHDVPAKPVEEM